MYRYHSFFPCTFWPSCSCLPAVTNIFGQAVSQLAIVQSNRVADWVALGWNGAALSWVGFFGFDGLDSPAPQSAIQGRHVGPVLLANGNISDSDLLHYPLFDSHSPLFLTRSLSSPIWLRICIYMGLCGMRLSLSSRPMGTTLCRRKGVSLFKIQSSIEKNYGKYVNKA